jgi:hypothetical protein
VKHALIAVLLAAACGGRSTTPAVEDDTLPDPARGGPPRSELQRRQEAACERIAPRMTECAVEDARRTLTPDQLAELDLEKTAPLHTRKFIEECTSDALSSRQVRVYEVCEREAADCEELNACLDNLRPRPTESTAE